MSNYDDSIFRRDWEGRYASSGGRYEDYEPAYRYGSYLAGSERWRGRQWSEIEPDVRTEWEASHPKGTWERFKDSIRYGWESMTGSRDSSRQMGSSGGYDDSIFRRDWEGRYASSGGRYEDYEPAYRYGSYLSSSERWRGRQWSEIEPDVRTEWEASHPRGTWERFKDSIRYGWESMTGSRDSSRQMGSSGGYYDDSARQMGSPGRGAGSTGMGRSTAEYPSTMRGGPHNADETDFRRQGHHSYWTSGGSTNDYAPAYRYGADFADNDTNPNHQWADVEAYMRSEWEAYNKLEENSWEKNKDAIRHGWEKGKQYGRDTRSGHALR